MIDVIPWVDEQRENGPRWMEVPKKAAPTDTVKNKKGRKREDISKSQYGCTRILVAN